MLRKKSQAKVPRSSQKVPRSQGKIESLKILGQVPRSSTTVTVKFKTYLNNSKVSSCLYFFKIALKCFEKSLKQKSQGPRKKSQGPKVRSKVSRSWDKSQGVAPL